MNWLCLLEGWFELVHHLRPSRLRLSHHPLAVATPSVPPDSCRMLRLGRSRSVKAHRSLNLKPPPVVPDPKSPPGRTPTATPTTRGRPPLSGRR